VRVIVVRSGNVGVIVVVTTVSKLAVVGESHVIVLVVVLVIMLFGRVIVSVCCRVLDCISAV
jgi:hypothetical protein